MTLPYFFNQTTKENVTSYTSWDDTLVIFSTDNGRLPRSGGFNWPHRGPKYTMSEEGARGAAFVWRLFNNNNTLFKYSDTEYKSI